VAPDIKYLIQDHFSKVILRLLVERLTCFFLPLAVSGPSIPTRWILFDFSKNQQIKNKTEMKIKKRTAF